MGQERTGEWDDTASPAEQAFLARGYIVNTGPGVLYPEGGNNGITVKLVEGEDHRIWAYPDMNQDYLVDQDELGNLKPPVAVYDPSTGRVNQDSTAERIARR